MEKSAKKDCLVVFSLLGGLWAYGVVDLLIYWSNL